MNIVRHFVIELLQESFPDIEERRKYRNAAEKIVDINLAYFERILPGRVAARRYLSPTVWSPSSSSSGALYYGLNLVLVVALAGVSLGAGRIVHLGHCTNFTGDMEKGILGALGSPC